MGQRRTIELSGRYWRDYPRQEPLGEATEELSLGVDETVFLLIDVYGAVESEASPKVPAFYREAPGNPKGQIVRERIAPARAAARRAGLSVVYVTNHLSPGLTEQNEWRNLSIRTCGVDVLEHWQEPAEVLQHAEVIAPGENEPVVKKQHYSGFFETDLDSVLRNRSARNLVVVGFDSRICLAATVTDALYRDYRVIVLRESVATTEYPETQAGGWANFLAMRFIESCVGYTAKTDDFIRACD